MCTRDLCELRIEVETMKKFYWCDNCLNCVSEFSIRELCIEVTTMQNMYLCEMKRYCVSMWSLCKICIDVTIMRYRYRWDNYPKFTSMCHICENGFDVTHRYKFRIVALPVQNTRRCHMDAEFANSSHRLKLLIA